MGLIFFSLIRKPLTARFTCGVVLVSYKISLGEWGKEVCLQKVDTSYLKNFCSFISSETLDITRSGFERISASNDWLQQSVTRGQNTRVKAHMSDFSQLSPTQASLKTVQPWILIGQSISMETESKPLNKPQYSQHAHSSQWFPHISYDTFLETLNIKTFIFSDHSNTFTS